MMVRVRVHNISTLLPSEFDKRLKRFYSAISVNIGFHRMTKEVESVKTCTCKVIYYKLLQHLHHIQDQSND